MSKNEFREMMINFLKIEIDSIVANTNYEESEYLQGKQAGLMIAIDKLNYAYFLTEERGEEHEKS